jgi:hypothetical protein
MVAVKHLYYYIGRWEEHIGAIPDGGYVMMTFPRFQHAPDCWCSGASEHSDHSLPAYWFTDDEVPIGISNVEAWYARTTLKEDKHGSRP